MPHRIVPRAERLLTASSITGLAVTVLLLIVVAAGSVVVSLRTERANEASRVLRRDREVALGALLALERAETGQRGFLLTGKDAYLGTYEAGARAAPDRMDQLTAFRGADVTVARMAELARSKLAELARTVELARSGHREEALALVNMDVGQHTMHEYRDLSAQLIGAQNARIGELVAQSSTDATLLVWLDILSVAAVMAVAAQMLLGVRRAVALLRVARRDLAVANTGLAQSNVRLEHAVDQRTAELTNANEEVQRFAYIVSHDLRSPLVNVMGFTSELEAAQATLLAHMEKLDVPGPVRQAVTEDMPEAIRFIRASTAKMDRLINAILRLSREGQRRLQTEKVDMATLLHTAVDTMAHAIQASGATVTVGDMPPLVSDRLALEQVFGNLVENALKYAKPGRQPRVEVSGVQAGGRARFTVRDNGRGIAARDLGRIFDLFRRAGDQTVPGEGIGLAHVRALVRRLGGTITCTSELGEGTVFIVDLPTHTAEQTELAA